MSDRRKWKVLPCTHTLYRHVKTGKIYQIMMEGCNEADLTPVIIYRRIQNGGGGDVWVRPTEEFCDGRFEPVDIGII